MPGEQSPNHLRLVVVPRGWPEQVVSHPTMGRREKVQSVAVPRQYVGVSCF